MKIATLNLFNRTKSAADVEEELRFHVEMLERKYAGDGMCAEESKAAALKRFGDLEKVKKQCVEISSRNTLARRVLKLSSILIALAGLAIHLLSTDDKVARIGSVLIMIAVTGRLLLYVRGLNPATFLPAARHTSISVVSDTSQNSKPREG